MTNEREASTRANLITDSGFQFDTRYTQLPASFYQFGAPSPAPEPEVVIVNNALSQQLGLRLQNISPEVQARLLSGHSLAQGSVPFSQAYAGHQFGGFTILGDGRAHVLGEHVTPDGRRVDIQLKGSGQTPYSRRGDGKATLGPMLREYLISEAMAALEVPTTRSLAVVRTGDSVMREGPLPGAVLTRVAASHLRIGTFEFASTLHDLDSARALLEYAIERHYPELADAPCPALSAMGCSREASSCASRLLDADWFRPRVMNTDNMTISGETIDYGPCAFLDGYAKTTVFSSIDRRARYAFGNQPWIAQWNLARFCEALLPLIDSDQNRAVAKAKERLERFETWMNDAWTNIMREKLGLPGQQDDDMKIATTLLELMEETSSDYTNTFRALSGATPLPPALERSSGWNEWRTRWDERCYRAQGGAPTDEASKRMKKANPAVIPRNHLVEEALDAAVDSGDLGPFHRLLAALQAPYQERPELAAFQQPPPDSFRNYQTFCGT